MRQCRASLLALIAGALILAALAAVGPYVHYLWLHQLGQARVFWVMLGARIACFAVGFLLGALAVGANLALCQSLWRRYGGAAGAPVDVQFRGDRVVVLGRAPLPLWVTGAACLAGGLLVGLSTLVLAPEALAWFHRVPFGTTDPLFGRDAGFYVLILPFWQGLLDRLMLCLFLGALAAGGYYLARGVQAAIRGGRIPSPLLVHLVLLVAAFLILQAPALLFQRWNLVVEGTGLAGGAGYTDAAVRSPALLVMAGLCLAVALYLAAHRNPRPLSRPLWALASLLGAWLAATGVVPAAAERWIVAPNQMALERPYLAHGIESTRRAFGLDRIQVREHPARQILRAEDLQGHEATLRNIRLWDWEPLLQTYQQIQALRQYYGFSQVSVDRYHLGGEYRQVLLAAREVSRERLDEKALTWVNLHLKYTHGYGLAASPVNEITPEGLPLLLLKDLPPSAAFPALELEQPAIYYGRSTDWYVLGASEEPELDYPRGEANVYTHYAGTGGIPVGHALRRLAFALYLGDVNLLLSRAVQPHTRLMLDRDLASRLRRLAPFLAMDPDPYPVVSGGRLYWIADLYTHTRRYPYSRHHGGVNYLRNSVKAVVDAYHGTVHLYAVDPDDPLLRVYRSIFPGLFEDPDTLEADLRAHFRYPPYLFRLQAEVYKAYHVTEPQVFYNQEDLWAVPQEVYSGLAREVEPYYMVMSLPGEEGLEFVLMLPFTPKEKDNMIAWLAARCDAPHSGELVLYRFPKDRLVFGPRQIEARIQQDTLISQQVSLWDQRGSRVIRGNLMVIPIENSVLYVEPLYLQASEASIPELKRVIVAAGERVAMERTLPQALAAALGRAEPARQEPAGEEKSAPAAESHLARRALEYFRRADRALVEGDWSAYGREMKALRDLLRGAAGGGGSKSGEGVEE